MSAERRFAIKLITAFLALTLAAACAYGAASTAEKTAVYENQQGSRITLSANAIIIGRTAHALTDCSDATYFCVTSEVGFRVSFPRLCPPGTWFPEGGPMQWSSGFPHSAGSRYLNRDHSHFIYDWEPQHGLISFVYDANRDFAQLPANYAHNGPTVYYHSSGPRMFACQ